MTGINGKKWVHPKTGEVRYYVEASEVAALAGLEIHRHKTGNISSARLNGEEISNSEAARMLDYPVNIWLTEDGTAHMKVSGYARDYSAFWSDALVALEAQGVQ